MRRATPRRSCDVPATTPFFLEALLEAGAAEELPAGVAELVGRARRLGEPVRRLLEAASVMGQELDTGLLARISGQSLDEMLDALDAAAAARLLMPVADGAGRVGFAHALVREALTQTLPSARSTRLHAQALAALLPPAEAGSEEALVAVPGQPQLDANLTQSRRRLR